MLAAVRFQIGSFEQRNVKVHSNLPVRDNSVYHGSANYLSEALVKINKKGSEPLLFPNMYHIFACMSWTKDNSRSRNILSINLKVGVVQMFTFISQQSWNIGGEHYSQLFNRSRRKKTSWLNKYF
jgi:hypothetical protein